MDLERIVYIAYYTKTFNFKARTGMTKKFTSARMFSRKNHLVSSVGKKNIDDGSVIAVPIKMTLSEQDMIILKMGGEIDFD